jgi:hypothetical protein
MIHWVTRAQARVVLMDWRQPENFISDALLNPSTLPLKVAVEVGELNPVGGSHSTLQYGHTKSVASTLEFYFSSLLQGRDQPGDSSPQGTPVRPVDITKHVNWLMAFCYPSRPGEAPSPLCIVWPNVVCFVVVVKSIDTTYTRFALDGTPMAAKVSLDYAELRYTFKQADEQKDHGFSRIDPQLSRKNLGPVLNLWSKKR